jgi:membrane associated rhomboid family serine protease
MPGGSLAEPRQRQIASFRFSLYHGPTSDIAARPKGAIGGNIMGLPLYDESPFTLPRPPWVTWLLISINVFVFLCQVGAPEASNATFTSAFALVPAKLRLDFMPSLVTPLTSTFLHLGWEHLTGNMLFLFVFGNGVEIALGPARFLFLYLCAGMLAGFAYVAVNPGSTTELVGASGAIAAVLAAFLMIRPCARITVALEGRLVRIRAYWFIGLWLLIQLYSWAASPQDGVAYVVHVAGAASGAVFLLIVRPANLTLFQCLDAGTDEVIPALVSTIPVLVGLFILIAVLLLTR